MVEVYPETGEIKLLRYVSVDDCGNIISSAAGRPGRSTAGWRRASARRSCEELAYDDSGELITGTLDGLRGAARAALPDVRDRITRRPRRSSTRSGAKGIGEAATIGATPAAANAVVDALEPWGIHHLDMPFTPEKVWRAINEASANKSAAD